MHDRAYAELAEVAGMLHDYSTYKEGVRDNHAEKSSVDADDMQHWLRNPVEDYFFQKERAQKVAKELRLLWNGQRR